MSSRQVRLRVVIRRGGVEPRQHGLFAAAEESTGALGRDVIQACDRALRTGGALFRIWTRIVEGTYPAWFRPFADLEAAASALFEFEPQAVPGLLQTEDDARAIPRAGRRAPTRRRRGDRAARGRPMARQAILTGTPGGRRRVRRVRTAAAAGEGRAPALPAPLLG
jgi:hypothetical protein